MVQRLILAGLLLAAPALASGRKRPGEDGRSGSDPVLVADQQRGGPDGRDVHCRPDVRGAGSRRRQVIPDESQLARFGDPAEPLRGDRRITPAGSAQRAAPVLPVPTTSPRVINPDAIGQDVPLPNVIVHYRVNSRLPGNAAHAGPRPELPAAAADDPCAVAGALGCDRYPRRLRRELRARRIARRAGRACSRSPRSRSSRSASLMTIVSLFALARGARRRKTAGERVLPPGGSPSAADRELAAVARESQARAGTTTLVERALAATRVTAASLVGSHRQPVESRRRCRRQDRRSDRLGRPGPVRPAGPRPAARPRAVERDDRARSASGARPAARKRPGRAARQLETLADALAAFTAARYGSVAAARWLGARLGALRGQRRRAGGCACSASGRGRRRAARRLPCAERQA